MTFVHNDLDSCWKVQKALNEQGVDYEVVKQPTLPRTRRKHVLVVTGQRWLPVIEFEDGTAYRAESKEMAETIRAGKLFEHAGGADPTASLARRSSSERWRRRSAREPFIIWPAPSVVSAAQRLRERCRTRARPR